MLQHRAFGRPIDTLTVAIIDNRRPILSLLRAMLAAIGTGRIDSFESPTEALDAMAKNPPDLVIAAAAMQPMSGASLVRSMRRASSGPLSLVPAMITSPRAKPSLVEEALRAGAHHLLVLPTSASTLYRRLDWLINDDRPFELKGDRYVLTGLEERLSLSALRPVYVPAGDPPLPRAAELEAERPAGRGGKKARVLPH